MPEARIEIDRLNPDGGVEDTIVIYRSGALPFLIERDEINPAKGQKIRVRPLRIGPGAGTGFVGTPDPVRAPAFSPSDLGSKLAAWYDNRDTELVFTTASPGVASVQAGARIGFREDKRSPHQPVLLPTSWFGQSSSIRQEGNTFFFENAAGGHQIIAYHVFALGRRVLARLNAQISSGGLIAYFGSSVPTLLSTGTNRTGAANANASYLIIRASSPGTNAVVTVEEMYQRQGVHAEQTIASRQPIYRANLGETGIAGLEHGEGAHLVSTFGNLGPDCVVARAIPGVGAQIRTGQTISGAWSDTESSHEVVITNAPLSEDEQQGLASYLSHGAEMGG